MSENNLTSERLYSNTSFVIPPNERRDAVEFTEDNRSNRNLTNEQHLLVAIAWVLPSEKILFMLFPEAIFVDVVEDTNNEGRPLLTMTIAIANISYFKCKYIEHTSRGSTHTLVLHLGLVIFFI